jgi:hypothetical protein
VIRKLRDKDPESVKTKILYYQVCYEYSEEYQYLDELGS